MAGLFIMITLVSLLIPSNVQVTRGVVVNATAQQVFAQIANLQNWKNWQPVFKSNPLTLRFSKDSTTVNSYCEWESGGNQNKFIITAIGENQLTISLVRKGENDVVNRLSVLPLADPGQVQVEWSALTKLKWYPWEKFYGIFIEKISGGGYDEALKSLKFFVESN